MPDKTEKLNSSPGTQKLPSGTEKLGKGVTENLFGETRNAFPVFLKEGDIVKGIYKIIQRLGHPSGEAYVYLGECLSDKKSVVIKLYHEGFSAKEDIVKTLVKITHKDIINVIDYGTEQRQFYEVMEYAEGGTLVERLTKNSFSEKELVECVIPEVANGLKFCHEHRIIHRDIKPGNIFYRDKDKTDIVLGDFGISSMLDHEFTVKKTKGALTPDFAAPELFGYKGEHYVSREADYYALGITLIYLYLGKSPFYGLSNLQIMTKHTTERILPPDPLSDRFKKLLSGLLIKERKKRWGASEIERWLNGEDVPVYEDVIDQDFSKKRPPYKLTETIKANNEKELAVLLQTFNDVKLLKERLARKSLSQWLEPFDQTKADKVSRIEEKVKDADLALLEISCILDPDIPFFLTPNLQAESPEKLATLIDANWQLGKEHFLSGRISIWLKYTPGGEQILQRWTSSKIGSGSANNSDIVLESFLHCLNPQLEEAQVSIEPPVLDIGTIESISSVQRKFKILNKGPRGLLSCRASLNSEIDGFVASVNNSSLASKLKTSVEVATSGEKGKDIINLLPGESSEILIEIDAHLLPRFAQTYKAAILLTKNNYTFRDDYQGTIEIPISFYVDYPSYSKKKAKSPLIV